MADSVFNEEQFAAIYPVGVEQHYWNRARNMVIKDTLGRISPKYILDVGAGAGIVTRYLKERGFNIYGVEPANIEVMPDLREVLFTNKAPKDLQEDLKRKIDTVLLLDVIEHLPDPSKLIREILTSLPNAKSFIITVPAGKALWNNFDVFNGHYLRYDRSTLLHLFPDAEWEIRHCGYYFHLLYWPALLLAQLGFKRSVQIFPPRKFTHFIHVILARYFYLEYKIAPRSLVGSSMVLSIRRRSTPSTL